jgi:hypothetical protein
MLNELARTQHEDGVRQWQAPSDRRRFRVVVLLAMALADFGPLRTTHAQSSAGVKPSAMDPAIALLAEARLHFQNVRDYECRLIKHERVQGVLLAPSVMRMRVRTKPFSVYLYCESPNGDKGMAVCYVEGRNQGMMRVHPAHILGILGSWSVDPHDPRAFEKNRHSITEAGLGNLLDSTARYWEMERRLGKTLVTITDENIDNRPCTRIETMHPDRRAGSFYGYRCVLWLDKETHWPVGAETYDWPRQGGPVGGELLETYRYLDLRCNIGLGDEAFAD